MLGLGVYDCLSRDITDPETGEIYPALSCINNAEMAARCTVPGAKKAIWAIKASASFNSDCAIMLREGLKSGRVRLLVNEYDGEEAMKELKGFSSLSPMERTELLLPYINTTLLVDELVKLEHDEVGGKIKISERTGMRKDRYSSIAYNYLVAVQEEMRLTKRYGVSGGTDKSFIIKPPKSRIPRRRGL